MSPVAHGSTVTVIADGDAPAWAVYTTMFPPYGPVTLAVSARLVHVSPAVSLIDHPGTTAWLRRCESATTTTRLFAAGVNDAEACVWDSPLLPGSE